MLTQEQILEIREHLENAKNPIFFFDNDPDGLCSFLLLQRYIGRGKGVVIKSLPDLDETYFRRVEELNSDYIFVLDKPTISQEFLDLAEKAGIPLVHIDHHNVSKTPIKYYYNTYYVDKKYDPVSYLCYAIANKKEDMWLAAIGCITDSFLPDFIPEIEKKYPGLIDFKYKTAFDILYKTKLGEICMVISFAIRDKTSNVVSLMKFLRDAKTPYDILEENNKTRGFLEKFKEINSKYQKLLEKSEAYAKDKIIFFSYGGDLSINQYLANEIAYKHPKKPIVVIYKKGSMANVSLRWEKDIRTATVNAISTIEGASGGGHEHASGARIPSDKIGDFKEKLLEEIKRLS